jgi:NAD(P)-dependent dehydrogenase (short-subunit alcohol dehydrogenase family)
MEHARLTSFDLMGSQHRNPGSVDLPGAVAVRIDVTDPESVTGAAAAAGDVNLLINNAGSSTGAALLDGDLDAIRLEMETHYFGTLGVIRAFTPVIAAQGGGTVLNVLSVLSRFASPASGAYSSAKSAEWGLTNALRLQLAEQDIRVSGLHVGYMDTDMAAGIDAPKSDPAQIARLALDGLAADRYEILGDDVSRQVQAGLAQGVAALYPSLV